MNFAEMDLLKKIFPKIKAFGRVESLAEVSVGREVFPIYGLVVGSDKPDVPTFFLSGGVHGLERVGSHVVINYLSTLLTQLEWDQSLQDIFQNVRIAAIPIVNPWGVAYTKRANPNGVDIMRNAPIQSDEPSLAGVSGQYFSPRLPWYRGNPEEMEVETQTLVDFVRKEVLPAPFSMALDVHSGFGMRDRIWFPFSHTRKAAPHRPLIDSFVGLVGETLPFHVYLFEQQTDSYLINGDPWDYMYLEQISQRPNNPFVPWTLEMGSWTWLRKNPAQMFYATGFFNPILPHRYRRIMRRHRSLIDLFWRGVMNHNAWSTDDQKMASSSRTGS